MGNYNPKLGLPMFDTLPTPFESLAGICKFIAVSKINPDFYAKHQHPVEFASAFLRTIASANPPLEKAFREALPIELSKGAVPIQQALLSIELTEERLHWFDSQLTEVLRILLPVVGDADLPGWLSESKWAIEGAFHKPSE